MICYLVVVLGKVRLKECLLFIVNRKAHQYSYKSILCLQIGQKYDECVKISVHPVSQGRIPERPQPQPDAGPYPHQRRQPEPDPGDLERDDDQHGFGGCELGDDLELGSYQGSELNLESYLAEVISLALPVQPLCGPDCEGLCAHCGADLNRVGCDCADETVKSPFAALGTLLEEKK